MLVLLSRYYLLTFFFFIPVEAHLNTYEKKKKCYNANFENAARRSYVDPLSDFDLVFFSFFLFFFGACTTLKPCLPLARVVPLSHH